MFDLRIWMFCLTVLATVAGWAPLAAAAETEAGHEAATQRADSPWSVDFTAYGWLVSIDGELGRGSLSNSFGIGLIDILKSLHGIAMADMTVRYERFGLFGDGMWARLETSESRPSSVAASVSYDIDLRMDMAWGSGGGFYRFRPTEKLTLDPYVAARWWRVHPQLEIVDNGGPLPDFSGGRIIRWADPVFGMRITYAITDAWLARVTGDVGGGVSKVSWQAMVGGGYRFTSWLALDVAYRAMGVDYRKDGNELKMTLKGLLIGLNFRY